MLTDGRLNFVTFLQGDFSVYIRMTYHLAVTFFERFIFKFVKHIVIQKSIKLEKIQIWDLKYNNDM